MGVETGADINIEEDWTVVRGSNSLKRRNATSFDCWKEVGASEDVVNTFAPSCIRGASIGTMEIADSIHERMFVE